MRPFRIPRLTSITAKSITAKSITAKSISDRSAVTVTAAVMTAAALAACSGPAPSHPAAAGIAAQAKAPPVYYLALGDSLAQGVQPNAAGISVETPDGYPDQVYAALRRSHPTLRLVKLGCPGETTVTMINGGICRYGGGSQLKAAEAFLQQHRAQAHSASEHRGRVLLVTLDIGANDPEACSGQPSFSQLAVCAVKGVPSAVTHLATIVDRLKAAAGPGVRIVGMNYYLPALAEWHHGLSGRAVAWTAEKLAATFNALLDRVYAKAGMKVADVFGAFQTSDFGTHGAASPRNVTLLCQWTWECAAAPRGPNQHAN
ncbi:MAG TPA: SGNH/GDSL hydrolase family protein, partial [Streptosporangiaceae bacterium]|nr:SGNH/GDSL hydrolase family protein [Streptosporangiaceae bacterium]